MTEQTGTLRNDPDPVDKGVSPGLVRSRRTLHHAHSVEKPGVALLKTIALIRHASAGATPRGGGDIDRPLDTRGCREIDDLSERLAQTELSHPLVICSPAHRALETLAGLQERGYLVACPIAREDDLYLASSSQLMERLRCIEENVEMVVLIGHNPGIGMLAHELAQPVDETHRAPRMDGSFRTAALAVLQFDVAYWREISEGRGIVITMNAPA